MLDLIVAIGDKMVGPALLLGGAALVWLIVDMHKEAVRGRRIYNGEDEGDFR